MGRSMKTAMWRNYVSTDRQTNSLDNAIIEFYSDLRRLDVLLIVYWIYLKIVKYYLVIKTISFGILEKLQIFLQTLPQGD